MIDSLLLPNPVQPAYPHALPFRIIFEEYRKRRPDDLLFAAGETLKAPMGGGPIFSRGIECRLRDALTEQEDAYRLREKANEAIRCGAPPTESIGDLDRKCNVADTLLKSILHKLNGQALCLSGGGIRSASFNLGLLEGFARFRQSADSRILFKALRPEAFKANGKETPPFRKLVDELRYNCYDKLLYAAGEIFAKDFNPDPVEGRRTTERTLDTILDEQEAAYVRLRTLPEADPQTDATVHECQTKDEQLRKILRKLEVLSFMERLDYLSTVSGGGYIGSWLSSWIIREQTGDCTADEAYRQVLDALAGRALGTGGDPDPQQTQHLRRYTSYLAPALGANLDTAALGAIVLRNLIVNWTLLIPLLFAVVSATQALAILLEHWSDPSHSAYTNQLNWLLVALFLFAAFAVAFSLPSHRRKSALLAKAKMRLEIAKLTRTSNGQSDEGKVTVTLSKPVPPNWNNKKIKVSGISDASFCGSFRATASSDQEFLYTCRGPQAEVQGGYVELDTYVMRFVRFLLKPRNDGPAGAEKLLRWFRSKAIIFFGVCVLFGSTILTIARGPLSSFSIGDILPDFAVALIGYCVLAFCIWLADWNRRALLSFEQVAGEGSEHSRSRTIRRLLGAAGAAVFAAATSTGLLFLLRRFGYGFLWSGNHTRVTHRLFVVLAVPAVLAVLLITATLFCALLGLFEQEEDREWWARAGAVLLSFMICWVTLQTIVLYGMDLNSKLFSFVISAAGLALGVGTSALGFSGATSAGPRPIKSAQLGTVGKFLQKYDLLLPILGGVALSLIAIGAVSLEEHLRQLLVGSKDRVDEDWGSAIRLFGIFAVITVVMNWAIDFNLFTLQGMYRMRLMRAFLGASNLARRPDPFTRFDPRDTPHLCELSLAPGVPIHIINAALNLTATKDTALRQRMAENFTFSALTAGGWRVGYACTADFGGGPRGLTLATAMSISGSAFNPNMGYHTSPLLSLLMTFFNLRLGVWLPNPKWPSLAKWPSYEASPPDKALKHIRTEGPSFSLVTLIGEALARTDDESKWIELTDGGHFENLGLYEMVLRRCKCIVVSDAGADPKCEFEDLGNAIRKIKIDLGIPIDFNPTDSKRNFKMKAGMKADNSYCAVARIGYHCVDTIPNMKEDQVDGWLIYIKASLTGREPGDVLQYALTHDDFPHESTANQFFNEAQFESYRHLGSFIVDEIVKQADSKRPQGTFDEFRCAAQRFWNDAT